MNKPVITVMVGNIGSGKTTLCKQIAGEVGYVISRDSLRYMMGAGKYIFNPKLEGAVFRSEQRMIEEFMKLKVDIIVDDVGVSKEYRRCYIQLAKKYGYEIVAYVFPIIEMKTAVDRRMNDPHGQDSREIWEGVYKKFAKMYTRPTIEEGFSAIFDITPTVTLTGPTPGFDIDYHDGKGYDDHKVAQEEKKEEAKPKEGIPDWGWCD